MPTTDVELEQLANREYKWGFVSDIEAESAPPGLNEDIVRFISARKGEPQWMLDWRLKAFRHWQTMTEPHHWAKIKYPPIDYQDHIYYSAPKPKYRSLDEVDPELLAVYDKLGVPVHERKALLGIQEERPEAVPAIPPQEADGDAAHPAGHAPVAVDAVFDSVSVKTTFQKELAARGIIFCSFSEAVREHPELVRRYLGSVVPYSDNFFATLNSAVFSDGSFVYIPRGVRCPMELSTYFRINAAKTGQFERTLIIADEGAYVSYLEGCTAPMRDENQLHAAVVELVALENATIKYSTVQNWYPGDEEGRGGIYNFVTKRGACRGAGSKITWTQVETGSAITWKYPSCILQGDNSVGEFYSVALTNHFQQADTGTKMIHIGKNTRSTIVSKGISAGRGQNTYRGLVKILKGADHARNYTQCDSMLLGDECGAHTEPYIDVKNTTARVEHEASTSKIGEDQLFYCKTRGIALEDAVNMIVNGFCKEVFRELPMEFAVEAQKLLGVSLEGSVG
jgi:Fe-S cluster assembly protein SufB